MKSEKPVKLSSNDHCSISVVNSKGERVEKKSTDKNENSVSSSVSSGSVTGFGLGRTDNNDDEK